MAHRDIKEIFAQGFLLNWVVGVENYWDFLDTLLNEDGLFEDEYRSDKDTHKSANFFTIDDGEKLLSLEVMGQLLL